MEPGGLNEAVRSFHVVLETGSDNKPLVTTLTDLTTEIPPGAITSIGRVKSISLVDYYGNQWKVAIRRTITGQFLLTRGWLQFKRDASIGFGVAIVFNRVSPAAYLVALYDRTAVEREVIRLPWFVPESYNNTASFCRFMVVKWRDRLKIPGEFVAKYGSILRHTTVAVECEGSQAHWLVHCDKLEDKVFFQEGWNRFIADNNIVEGDFITVRCGVQTARWTVTVFEATGCQKGVARSTTYQHHCEQGSTSSVNPDALNEEANRQRSSFVRMMNDTTLRSHVDLPKPFGEAFADIGRVTLLRLENSNGNGWDAEVRRRPNTGGDRFYLIANSWSTFTKANNISTKDLVLFTLIKPAPGIVIRVDVVPEQDRQQLLNQAGRGGMVG